MLLNYVFVLLVSQWPGQTLTVLCISWSLNIFDVLPVLMYRNSRTGYDVLPPIVHPVNNRPPNNIYSILYNLEINLLLLLLIHFCRFSVHVGILLCSKGATTPCPSIWSPTWISRDELASRKPKWTSKSTGEHWAATNWSNNRKMPDLTFKFFFLFPCRSKR